MFPCSAVIWDRSLPSNAAATKGEICRHNNKELVAGTSGGTLAGGIIVTETARESEASATGAEILAR